jgi:hypothetical protein
VLDAPAHTDTPPVTPSKAPPVEPAPSPAPRGGLLFTAFEPRGDEHAAAVIAELRRRHPNLPMYAWGGPKI